ALMPVLNHDLGVQLAVVKLLEGINSRDLAANLLVQIPFDDPGPTVLEPPVESQPRLPAYPLSFEQQRLWLLDQFEPGNPAYNMPAGARLSGPLDVSALQNCLDEIVRRHEVLRTSIETVDGEPIQVVLPPAPVALRVMALPSPARREREAGMHRLMRPE